MTIKQHLGRWLFSHLPCSRRTFDILRFEFHAARQHWRNVLLPWRRLKIRRLYSRRGLSLNVGSGGQGLPGWINTDAVAHHPDITFTHDLRHRFPLADQSVKRIFAEHVIEHLNHKEDVPRVFEEFFRMLENGGVVRIIVPDVPRFMRAYLDADFQQWKELGFTEGLPSDMATSIELVNHVFHQGGEHLFGWDFEAMEHALRCAGFSNVVRQTFGQSLDQGLALDRPEHAPYSLYVEAVR
jgi:predicted SAM-dependent methyltransferase